MDESERNEGWVAMMRTSDLQELIETSPLTFVLATVIALRARYQPGVSHVTGLHPGEARLGDFEKCGLSEQEYRTAKRNLEKWGFATFRPTPKGTIGKLTDKRLFDVLRALDQRTDQRTANGGSTTNQEGKKGKNEKEKGFAPQTAFEIPSQEQFYDYVETENLDLTAAESFYQSHIKDNWTANGGKIRDWRKCLVAFCTKLKASKKRRTKTVTDDFGNVTEPDEEDGQPF